MVASRSNVSSVFRPFSTVYVGGGSKTNATAIRFLSSSRTFGRWRLVLARRRCWNWSSSCADMAFFLRGCGALWSVWKTGECLRFCTQWAYFNLTLGDLVSYWAAYEGIRKIMLWVLGRVFKAFAKCRRVVSRLRTGQQLYQHSCLSAICTIFLDLVAAACHQRIDNRVVSTFTAISTKSYDCFYRNLDSAEFYPRYFCVSGQSLGLSVSGCYSEPTIICTISAYCASTI